MLITIREEVERYINSNRLSLVRRALIDTANSDVKVIGFAVFTLLSCMLVCDVAMFYNKNGTFAPKHLIFFSFDLSFAALFCIPIVKYFKPEWFNPNQGLFRHLEHNPLENKYAHALQRLRDAHCDEKFIKRFEERAKVLRCPITMQLCNDPVSVSADGTNPDIATKIYERMAILEAFKRNRCIDPLTNINCAAGFLIPVLSVQNRTRALIIEMENKATEVEAKLRVTQGHKVTLRPT